MIKQNKRVQCDQYNTYYKIMEMSNNDSALIKIRYGILHDATALIVKKYRLVKENNIQKITHYIKQSYKASQIELYDDKQKQIIAFNNDKEILDYFIQGRVLYCKVLQKASNNDQSFISVQSNTQSQIQETPLIDKEIQFEKTKEKQVIKCQVKSQHSELANNMKKAIEELLKKNIAQIAAQINYSTNNSNKPFNALCSLCKKNAQGTIFACELNLKVVCCKQCSAYLKYQLPFPFKPYTDPSLYQKQRDQQPIQAEKAFNFQMQKQRGLRNQKISDKLKGLPIFND